MGRNVRGATVQHLPKRGVYKTNQQAQQWACTEPSLALNDAATRGNVLSRSILGPIFFLRECLSPLLKCATLLLRGADGAEGKRGE